MTRKAKFAGGALGTKPVGEFEGGPGPGGDGGVASQAAKGEEAGGLLKGERDAEGSDGGAQDAAAGGGFQRAKSLDFESDGGGTGGGGDGTATTADRLSRKKEVGEGAGEFRLPVGLFLAGEFGEVGEGSVEGGILGAQQGKDVVAEAVAGVDGIEVGGVFAPGLAKSAEVGEDLRAGGSEERAKNAAAGAGKDGVDAGEAGRPGSAEELHEDGFGLVVEGVRREDGIGGSAGEVRVEDAVAEGAGSFFQGLSGLARVGRRVDTMLGKGDVQAGAELLDEGCVVVRLRATETMVDVDGGQPGAQTVAWEGVEGVEGGEKRDRVRSARKSDAEAGAGGKVGSIEGERRGHWLVLHEARDRGKGGGR